MKQEARSKKMIKQTMFAAIMTAAMISGSLVPVSAKNYANQKRVRLELDEYWADSDSIKTVKAACDGENTGKKSVYFIIEYMDKDGEWHYSDTSLLVESGLKCPTLSTRKYTKKTNFRLQLNPYGVKKAGAKANGRIWPVKVK